VPLKHPTFYGRNSQPFFTRALGETVWKGERQTFAGGFGRSLTCLPVYLPRFVSHDLSMMKCMSDRVGVMYLGVMVEMAQSDELYANPVHAYTQALLSAVPVPGPDAENERERIVLEGDVPSPVDPPSGCRSRTRCPYVTQACAHDEPVWREVGPEHWFAACHCIG